MEPGRDQAMVLQAVTTAVTDAFSFDNRSLGQAVFESEVIAAMQGVAGVLAVDIIALGANAGAVPPVSRPPVPMALPSRRARLDQSGKPVSAQLLTIDPNRVRVSAAS